MALDRKLAPHEVVKPEEYLSKREAAHEIRVSEHTISAWLSQRRLRRFKAGSRTLVRRSDLLALVRFDDVA